MSKYISSATYISSGSRRLSSKFDSLPAITVTTGGHKEISLKMLHIQKRQVFIKILPSGGIWHRAVFMNITTFQRNFCYRYHRRWNISTSVSTGYGTATQTLEAPYSSGTSKSDYTHYADVMWDHVTSDAVSRVGLHQLSAECSHCSDVTW
jgi:hypothetical protein